MVFVFQLQDERQIIWHGRQHHHAPHQFELHFFLRGVGRFRNGSQTFPIEAHSLHFTPPGMEHQILATDILRPITYYAILVNVAEDDSLAQILEGFCGKSGQPRRLGEAHRFFFAELLEYHASGRPELLRAAEHEFQAFLYRLAAQRGAQTVRRGHTHVDRALVIMQDSLEQSLDLDTLCSRLNLSKEHLVRLFTEQMGISPMKYFGRFQMEAAKAMLSSTRLQVQEISERLHYENPFNFTRAFRRAVGQSPSQYRQQVGLSPSPASIHAGNG